MNSARKTGLILGALGISSALAVAGSALYLSGAEAGSRHATRVRTDAEPVGFETAGAESSFRLVEAKSSITAHASEFVSSAADWGGTRVGEARLPQPPIKGVAAANRQLPPDSSTGHVSAQPVIAAVGSLPSSYPLGGHAPHAPGATVPNVIGFMMVSPALPGSSLAIGNQKVSVQGYPVAAAGEQEGIDVEITRAAESAVPPTLDRAGKKRRQLAGFSEEEALFRMRWGWAAADQAKRAALENASGL